MIQVERDPECENDAVTLTECVHHQFDDPIQSVTVSEDGSAVCVSTTRDVFLYAATDLVNGEFTPILSIPELAACSRVRVAPSN